MFAFSKKILTENPSEHSTKLALVSKDTISSKTSTFFKFKLFSLSLSLLAE
ncbi:MAG: hypothetical protein LBQ18_04825 [Campylobacteraceae bacterium]|jgi:hypothetical protein|nr:hypothetical protein [Campylobacteraceae bacterium]